MFEHAGVVGCGRGAALLAGALAEAGVPVVAVALSRPRVELALSMRVQDGRLDGQERDAILSRIRFTADLAEVRGCDLVLESGLDDLDARRTLLHRIEAHLTPGAILATTEESSLEALASGLDRPTQLVALRLVGADGMEIEGTEQTAPGVLLGARVFVGQLGRTPLEVAPAPTLRLAASDAE